MNKAKAKGTKAEIALVKWFRANGYPWAERLALAGADDVGDVSLLPGRAVIAEVKSHAAAATGQPSAGQLARWMTETETERVNAGADHALLVVKRAGTTDPGRWWCYVTLATISDLTAATVRSPEAPRHVVCVSVATATLLLRGAGYGDPAPGDRERGA